MSDHTSTSGNSYANPGESFGPIGDPAKAKKKRGGRKLGSKNKPKSVKPTSIEAALIAELAAANAQIAVMQRSPQHTDQRAIDMACACMGQIASARISAMDSENRLVDMLKQHSALARRALEMLREVSQ